MKENKEYFKLLWKYLKEDKVKLILYVFLYFAHLVPSLIIPYLFGLALDYLVSSNLSAFVICLVLSQVLNLFINVFMSMLMSKMYYDIEETVTRKLAKDLYNKVNDLPSIAFEDIGVGEFSNRMYTDPNTIVSLASDFLDGIYSIVRAVFIFIAVFSVSLILGVQLAVFAFVMYVITIKFMPKIKSTQEEVSKSSDVFLKTNTEYLSGIREIKSLGIKDTLANKVFTEIDNVTSKRKKINLFETYYYGFNNGVYYLFQILIFLTMGFMYVKGNLTLAIYMMLQTYIWNLDYAVGGISKIGVNYSKILVALKRIDEIINNKLYSSEKFGETEENKIKGFITFKDVKFKYKKDEEYTLNNLNIVFKPNQKNAIIGKSGNGKSTIFNLLLRYFDATEGEILIDDTNILDFTEKSLRDNISVIRQSPFLFNDTIKENFRMVKESVTDKEIEEVCKKAYIHDYIMSLKNGYDTVIGEGGVNLSGGQKQRIAIARTLLLNTKIILFDEATSALDNVAQEYIKKTIDNLVKDHTVIVVAHRLSTIVDSDNIYVIDKGALAGEGSHGKLIKNNEIYKNLYKNEDLIK